MDSKKKGIFDSLLHPMTDREKNEALEEAKKLVADLENKLKEAEQRAAANAARADAAEKKVAEFQATAGKTQSDIQVKLAAAMKAQSDLQAQLNTAQSDLRLAKATAVQNEQRANIAEAKLRAIENEKLAAQQQVAVLDAAKAQILATHTLTKEETLSHLSLKYYGHATEPYWRIIYEANKDVIGPDPNHVRAGLVLKIPVLPDAMK